MLFNSYVSRRNYGDRIMKHINPILLTALTCALLPQISQAQSLAQFINKTSITGDLRTYYFDKLYDANNVQNASAFSIGGLVNLKTAPFFSGFKVGLSFYTANSLGLNNLSQLSHTDPTLMGYRNSIDALGQAYIKYSNRWGNIKVGDQLLKTPWMNPSDSRMLPVTYQAIYANIKPINGLNIYALREFRWKSKTSANYFKDNLYYAPGSGGTSYGGEGGLPANSGPTSGTLAFGASYNTNRNFNITSWYYNFYQFAHLFYTNAYLAIVNHTDVVPIFGAQYVREWGSKSYLNNIAFNTEAGVGSNATAYGLLAGVKTPIGQLTIAYNILDNHSGSIGGGAIISPYTAGYTSDPLYTTSMLRGLVELGPGHAWRMKYTTNLIRKQLLLTAAFAKYYTRYYDNANDLYFDVTYDPRVLKGLSVRDRIEIANGGISLEPGNKPFIYNRVMLQYAF